MLADGGDNGALLTDKPALHAAFAPVGAACTVMHAGAEHLGTLKHATRTLSSSLQLKSSAEALSSSSQLKPLRSKTQLIYTLRLYLAKLIAWTQFASRAACVEGLKHHVFDCMLNVVRENYLHVEHVYQSSSSPPVQHETKHFAGRGPVIITKLWQLRQQLLC